ncbi:MAG TPA: hypothetical protein VKZ51_06080 [Cyclobacteriaceae bacterium]|nr:hypothetical protein [Cyclobacteriaceae bacterium]
MRKKQENRNVIKERMTILLVFFFCVLISSSEYLLDEVPGTVNIEQQEAQEEGSAEGKTFLNAAVDAVVPFVFATVDHIFHLIYEIEVYELRVFAREFHPIKHANHFSEILLERIISTNAP